MYRYNFIICTLPFLVCAPGNPLHAQLEGLQVPLELTFPEALRLAVEQDPRLKLYELEAEASDGQIEQAEKRPNPVVGAELENVLGTGALSGVDGLEITLGVSQLIETSGKREKRTRLAREARALVDWDREARLAELEGEVRHAFSTVLLAQKDLALRIELLELANRSHAETLRMVEAARSPAVEGTRTNFAIHQQQFLVEKAERSLKTAKVELAALWGLTSFTDFDAIGELYIEETVPPIEELVSLLPRTASLARFDRESRFRDAALALERSRAKPNFEVFAAGRYLNEGNGDIGIVAGIEVPWPRFDKNEGNIRTARARKLAVSAEHDVVHRSLVTALASAHRQMEEAHTEMNSLKKHLLPAAERTLSDVEEGYEKRQFTLLSVLESRRILYDVREAQLDTLRRYVAAQHDIESLTRTVSIQLPTEPEFTQ